MSPLRERERLTLEVADSVSAYARTSLSPPNHSAGVDWRIDDGWNAEPIARTTNEGSWAERVQGGPLVGSGVLIRQHLPSPLDDRRYPGRGGWGTTSNHRQQPELNVVETPQPRLLQTPPGAFFGATVDDQDLPRRRRSLEDVGIPAVQCGDAAHSRRTVMSKLACRAISNLPNVRGA